MLPIKKLFLTLVLEKRILILVCLSLFFFPYNKPFPLGNSSLLLADGPIPDVDLSSPSKQPFVLWSTGPLIASTSSVSPYGTFDIELYLNFINFVGKYNDHWHAQKYDHNFFSLNTQIFFYAGLTSFADILIAPQFFYNNTANQNGVAFGDLPIELNFLLLDYTKSFPFPGIKFGVEEIFPTGPYQRLNPRKKLTDQGGFGTFATTLSLDLYQAYHIVKHHFFTTTYNLSYTFSTPVSVHGFNAYGGGYGTEGTILPGNIFEAILSFELSLTQNIVLAIDNVYTQVNKTKFFGTPGISSSGGIAKNGFPASKVISFAPAIEYNFNPNMGLIVGCWFSAWGKNFTIFRIGNISFNAAF